MTKTYSPEQALQTAQACHESNRAYCEDAGLEVAVPWDELTDEGQTSILAGVDAVFFDPRATPESMHENWRAWKAEAGWIFGETKDEEVKEHPNMVPWADLDPAEQFKDELFITCVRNFQDQFDNPDREQIDAQMAEADRELGDEAEIPKSIRVLTRELRNRVEAVMAKTKKRPGDLVAFSAELAEMGRLDYPLMDSTE